MNIFSRDEDFNANNAISRRCNTIFLFLNIGSLAAGISGRGFRESELTITDCTTGRDVCEHYWRHLYIVTGVRDVSVEYQRGPRHPPYHYDASQAELSIPIDDINSR